VAAAIIGVTCLLIAGFAWAMRIPATKVHAALTADAVTFRLADAWHWSGTWRLGEGLFRLDEMDELSLPPELSAQPELKGRAWLDAERGQMTLSDLELGPHGTLALLRNPTGSLTILSLNASLRGQAQITGAPAVSAGDAPSRSAALRTAQWDIPGTISFYDAGRGSIPARIELSTSEKITWRNIPIERLSFAYETGGDTEGPAFISGIRSGTVTVSETGEKFTLREKDQLYLDEPAGLIQEMEIGADGLRISFEARVKKASLGVTGFEENLVPTWLSYVYHQERLGFFWGAVVFLWGILWSARQLLFK
jgi:hypothetical protein